MKDSPTGFLEGASPDGGYGLSSSKSNWAQSKKTFLASKRVFDVVLCLLALPMFLVICGLLIVLNPIWNKGPLFFSQRRTGKDGEEFVMFKFRSMTAVESVKRGPDDPLEQHRITKLGYWIRRTKVDEIPQLLNVLNGDMSIVGPRPELVEFKSVYQAEIPYYSARWAVKPGVTGYAQITQGYTESIEMVRRKSELDAHYIRNMSWKLDLRVIAKTFTVICVPHADS